MPLDVRISRFATGTLVVLLAAACQTWKTDQRPVPEVVQEQSNGKVALTLNNVGWIVVIKPTVEGDNIVGTRSGRTALENSRTAFPVTAIRSVETRQFNLVRTVGLSIAIALASLLAFYEP